MLRFRCEKTLLNEALSICSHAVGAKGTSPVTEGLLIQALSSVTVSGFPSSICWQNSGMTEPREAMTLP